MSLTPFHLAIPVQSLTAARSFYGELLGCPEGRSAESWVDFNLFGHQLVCHLAPSTGQSVADHAQAIVPTNAVDGDDVPVPHFGVVLTMPAWRGLADRLKAGNAAFLIEPRVRFEGQPGEQATFFLLDPSGNALEFKAFADIAGSLFAS